MERGWRSNASNLAQTSSNLLIFRIRYHYNPDTGQSQWEQTDSKGRLLPPGARPDPENPQNKKGSTGVIMPNGRLAWYTAGGTFRDRTKSSGELTAKGTYIHHK